MGSWLYVLNSTALHACTFLVGEFGLVFKGVWTHEAADGNEMSTEVAIKTIKSMNLVP